MAQLGARLNGIQKVRGSNPLGSTKRKAVTGSKKDNSLGKTKGLFSWSTASVLLMLSNPFINLFFRVFVFQIILIYSSVTHLAAQQQLCAERQRDAHTADRRMKNQYDLIYLQG